MQFLENFFGTVAMATTIIGLLPQVYKSFKTKSTSDVSMLMLINCFVCSFSWVIYGMFTKSDFVVWSNIFSLGVSIVSILQKRHYDQKNNNI